MSRTIAVVMAAVFASGCASYKGSKGVAQAGGALMIGTLLIGASVAQEDSDVDGGEAAEVMIPIIVLGGIIALLGIGGMAIHGSSNAADDPPVITQPLPPPPIDPRMQQLADADRKRRAAWDLTQQARTAAYANDCPRVAYLAQRVIELDRPTFDTVFSRDPYIVKCAPKPPQEPPRSIPIPPLNPTPPPDPPPTEQPAPPP